MNAQRIAEKIQRVHFEHYPILVAIDGFGGSGKSTLVDQLKELLQNAEIVHIDDFIVKEKLDEPTWDKGAFDRDRLERQVLIPAKQGHLVSYQKLHWAENILSGHFIIPSCNYLIVEGISTSHPDISHYYHFKIWVDTPIEIAKRRGHARDASNENANKWDLWAENDLAYQAKYHPERYADFLVENG